MKKILTFIVLLISVVVLAGCKTTTESPKTAPTFVGISIEGVNPHNGSELVPFYKQRTEALLVEVTLSNPDNVDIRSIVIDGYYYRHTRFLETSTSTVIRFYIEAGDVLGEHIFSVDDIEYFDGSDTYTTLVDTNNEFLVLVYENIPKVEREDYKVETDNIRIGIRVTDTDSVIDDDSLFATLYAGQEFIEAIELVDGYQSIEFDGLDADKQYEVKVTATFNLGNNQGLQEDFSLMSHLYVTAENSQPGGVIENLTTTSNGVIFDVNITDDDMVIVPGTLQLVLKNEGHNDIYYSITGDVTDFEITGLLNDNNYEIELITNYDLRDGLFSQQARLSGKIFTTKVQSVPVPVLDNLSIEENRITFDIVIDDPTGIILEDTLVANLYIDGVLESSNIINNYTAELQVFNVLAGFEFTIEVVASYDLNDGSGIVPGQIIMSEELTTKYNDKPSVTVGNVEVKQGYIILDVSINDVHNTLKNVMKATLYEDGIVVKEIEITDNSTEIIFVHPVTFESRYSVDITADYNLRDGNGPVEGEVLYRNILAAFEPLPPAAEFLNADTTKDGFTFEAIVLDADGTIETGSVYILIEKEGEADIMYPMEDIGLKSFVVTGLLSNNAYKVSIIADYDVLDGSDIQENQILFTASLQTLPRVLPTTTISNEIVTDETITVDITVIDPDGVAVIGSIYAQLYRGATAIGDPRLLSVGSNNGVVFNQEILSDNVYDVKVFTDFDRKDGDTDESNVPLGVYSVRTEAKSNPSATIQNIIPLKEEVSMDIIVTDIDGVITGNTKVVLYIGEQPFLKNEVPYEIPLTTGLNPNVTFTEVYSNQNFNIRVVTDYDLNDGVNVIEEELLDFDFTKTYENNLPLGDITSVSVGIDTITFSAVVLDEDFVITSNLSAVLYSDGVQYGLPIPLTVGETTNQVFTGLISDNEYTIRLVTDFNLRDQDQLQETYLLDSYTTNTNAYTPPTAISSSFDRTIDTIKFDITVSDPDNTSTVTGYYVELYKNGIAELDSIQTLHEGLNQNVEFEGLQSGVYYEIRVFAAYDLFDGFGEKIEVVYARTEATIPKKVPVGNASGLIFDGDGVRFNFDYTDEDGTLIPDSLVAELYIPGFNDPIASNPIIGEEVVFDLTGFMSDFGFTIKIACEFDLGDGNNAVPGVCLDLDLRTPALTSPFVVIKDISINQDNVITRITVEDEDGVIEGNLIAKIYDDQENEIGSQVITIGEQDVVFDNITLDNSRLYSIVVEADMNMRNGTGLQLGATLRENQVMTFNKLVPQTRIYNEVITNNSISFTVEVLDFDATYVANTKAILLDNGVPVPGQEFALSIGPNVLDMTDIVFSGLISNHDYEVVFIIDYDTGTLNGIDYDYEMLRLDFRVLEKAAPSAEVSDVTITSSSIEFESIVTDVDSVIEGSIYAVLYKNGLPTTEMIEVFLGNTTDTFTGLLSNNEYDIKIIADYDLDDLNPVVVNAILGENNSNTAINSRPTAVITDVSVDSSTFTFDVEVTDVDSVITQDLQAELYINGTPTNDFLPITLGSVNTLSFTNLNSDSIYTVNIVADYDLNDGTNVDENYLMISNTKVTLANEVPEAFITSVDSGYDSIIFNVTVIDDNDVTTTNLVAQLYDSGVPVLGQTIVLTKGINVDKEFTGIYSFRNYEIKILTDYDLRNGAGTVEGYELASADKLTKSKETPEALITNQEVTNTQIQFDVEILDVADAIIGNLQAVLYKDGIAIGSPVVLLEGTNLDVTFSGLEFGSDYSVEIQVDYNKNIGNPDIEGFIMTSFIAQTRQLVIIDSITNIPLEVNFDLFIDDYFDVLYDDYVQITVFDRDSLEVADSFLVNVNTPTNSATVDILNYYNNHSYDLVFEAKIKDGAGSFTTEIVHEMSIETQTKQLQPIALGQIGVNGSQITSSVTLVLPDDERQLITGSVFAKLYEWNGITEAYVEVASVEVFDGDNTIVFSTYDGTVGTQYLITLEASLDWNEQDLGTITQVIEQRTFLYTEQN